MRKAKRVHVYTAVAWIVSLSPVIVLGVLRRVFAKADSIFELIFYNGIDLLIIALITTFAVSKYRSSFYSVNEEEILICKGALLKSSLFLNKKHLTALYISAAPLQRLFHSKEVRFAVKGKSKIYGKNVLFLSPCDTRDAVKKIFGDTFKKIYSPKIDRLISSMFIGSDTASGILLFAASLRRAGKIIGEEYARLIYEHIDPSDYIIALGVEPFLAVTAGILILGTTFLFIYRFIINCGFSLYESESCYLCNHGVLWKFNTYIRKKDISFLQIEQSFFMRCLGFATVKFFLPDKNAPRGGNRILIPAESVSRCRELISGCIRKKDGEKIKILPQRSAAAGLALFPLSVLLFSLLLMYTAPVLIAVPEIGITFLYAAIFFALFWLAFRIDAAKRTGIAVSRASAAVRTFKGLKLIYAEIPLEKITRVVLKRGIFGQRNNSVNIILYAGIYKLKVKRLICTDYMIGRLKEIV